jgi:hypothetical protein
LHKKTTKAQPTHVEEEDIRQRSYYSILERSGKEETKWERY